MSMFLKQMADYGHSDPSLYRDILAECCITQRRAEIEAFPDTLFSMLSGLAYLQIYPLELYELLFSGMLSL